MHLAQIRNYSVNLIVRCRGLFFSILYTCCCLNIEIHSFLNSLLLIKIHSNGLQHWQAQRGNYSVKLMSISMSISMWTCGNFTFSIKSIQWHPRHRQAGHCGLDWPNISPILANTTWRLFFRNFLRTFFWGKFALDRNISPILANMNASWRFFFRHLNTFFLWKFFTG